MERANPDPDIAFSETKSDLASQVREAELDHDAFRMPLKVCDLGRCKATCCHDGAWLGSEEAAVILELIAEHREELMACGWQGGEGVIREGRRWRTAVVEAEDENLAEDFPRHFPRTRCGFLDHAHRCVLQKLALAQGRHPWWWKPVSCWLHPLLLSQPQGRPRLTLARPGEDPSAAPDYPGFGSCTPCGMPGGAEGAAIDALHEELAMLAAISGRDLLKELRIEQQDSGIQPGGIGDPEEVRHP
ncbi:MAG: DUF3109 family protein [Akkermansiaceae bacterium]|jgi:hypothetical protein|nr:DUF3109 family protein [Akkermansiaceae bacterium]